MSNRTPGPQEERTVAIIAARNEGLQMRVIAERFGISHQRVQQILRRNTVRVTITRSEVLRKRRDARTREPKSEVLRLLGQGSRITVATAAVGISPKTWSRWLTEDAAFRTVVRATVAKARISASCQLKAAFLEQLRLGHDFYTAAARAGLCWRTAYQWREQDAEFRHAWKSVYRWRHRPKETPRGLSFAPEAGAAAGRGPCRPAP
jgi:transposase